VFQNFLDCRTATATVGFQRFPGKEAAFEIFVDHISSQPDARPLASSAIGAGNSPREIAA
jgi:hypothetical protein